MYSSQSQQRKKDLQNRGQQLVSGNSNYGGLDDFDAFNINSSDNDKLSFLKQMSNPLLTSALTQEQQIKQQLRQQNYLQGKAPKTENSYRNQALKQQLEQQNQVMQNMMKELQQNKNLQKKQEQYMQQLKQQEREQEFQDKIDKLKNQLNQIQQQQKEIPKLQNQSEINTTPQNLQQLIKEAIKEKMMEDGLNRLQNNQPFFIQPQQSQPQPQFMPQQYQYPPPQYYPPPPQSYQPQQQSYQPPLSVREPSKIQTPYKSPTVISPIPSKEPSIIQEDRPRTPTPEPPEKSISRKSSSKPPSVIVQQPSRRQSWQPKYYKDTKFLMNARNGRQQELNVNDPKYHKIKPFLQAVCFGIFIYRDNVKSELKRRELNLQEYGDLYTDSCIPTVIWLADSIKKPIKYLEKQKASQDLDISNINGGSQAKDFQKRSQIIIAICESFIQGLRSNISKFPENVKHFLALSFTKRSFLPEGVLFAFQLIRLSYNPTLGYLEDLGYKQREMMISTFLIINLFIANVLARPYEHINSFKDKPHYRKILKTVCSVIYIAVMKHFRQALKPQQDKWQQVKVEVRTDPIETRLPIKFSNDEDLETKVGTVKDICYGLYTEEDLKDFLKEQKSWLEIFINEIEGLLTEIDNFMLNYANALENLRKEDKIKQAQEYIKQIPQAYQK